MAKYTPDKPYDEQTISTLRHMVLHGGVGAFDSEEEYVQTSRWLRTIEQIREEEREGCYKACEAVGDRWRHLSAESEKSDKALSKRQIIAAGAAGECCSVIQERKLRASIASLQGR